MIKRILRFLKSLKVEVYETRGKSRFTGNSISVLFATKPKSLHYLGNHFFEPGHVTRLVTKCWLWRISHVSRTIDPAPTLLLLEMGVGNKKLNLLGDDFLKLCFWVRGEIDLPLDQQVVKKKDYKEQLRRIRKAGFEVELARDITQLENFYNNMYLPLVLGSHGESANPMSKQSFIENYEKLDLLLIKSQGQAVAGELVAYEKTIPELRALGVKDRDPNHLKSGVIGACYHFGLQHLLKKGYTKVDLGPTRGLFSDGVLKYKRKWGMRAAEPTTSFLLIKIVNWSQEVNALLGNMSGIYEIESRMVSLVFSENTELNPIADDPTFIEYNFYPGTEALYVFPLKEQIEFSKSGLSRLRLIQADSFN